MASPGWSLLYCSSAPLLRSLSTERHPPPSQLLPPAHEVRKAPLDQPAPLALKDSKDRREQRVSEGQQEEARVQQVQQLLEQLEQMGLPAWQVRLARQVLLDPPERLVVPDPMERRVNAVQLAHREASDLLALLGLPVPPELREREARRDRQEQ